MHLLSEGTFAETAERAAPWWIALGIAGVAAAILGGVGPLLLSLTLVGIGSDADLRRRLRAALQAEGSFEAGRFASLAGLVRRINAGVYAVLVMIAWASSLHLADTDSSAVGAERWRLAADLGAAALLALGYARLARRHS